MNPQRRFGLVVGGIFVLLAALPMLWGHPFRWLPGGPGLLLVVMGIIYPRSLTTLRRWWLALGHLLDRFTSPIILRLLYYGLLLPFALVSRRRPGASPSTYWRDPPSGGSLDRPF